MDSDRPSPAPAPRAPKHLPLGDLEVTVVQQPHRVVVTARGELDLNTVVRLGGAIAGHAGRRQDLVLDLGELTFIDSTGLRLLLRLRERAERDATALLVVTNEPVRRILTLSGMAALFDCVDRPLPYVPADDLPDGQVA